MGAQQEHLLYQVSNVKENSGIHKLLQLMFNPKECRIFWFLRMRGGIKMAHSDMTRSGGNIFMQIQQSASHMKAVMFSVNLVP